MKNLICHENAFENFALALDTLRKLYTEIKYFISNKLGPVVVLFVIYLLTVPKGPVARLVTKVTIEDTAPATTWMSGSPGGEHCSAVSSSIVMLLFADIMNSRTRRSWTICCTDRGQFYLHTLYISTSLSHKN